MRQNTVNSSGVKVDWVLTLSLQAFDKQDEENKFGKHPVQDTEVVPVAVVNCAPCALLGDIKNSTGKV
jgi:hypothetical protein